MSNFGMLRNARRIQGLAKEKVDIYDELLKAYPKDKFIAGKVARIREIEMMMYELARRGSDDMEDDPDAI